MSEKTFENMGVEEWESFLLNRHNSREISGHGGGSYVDSALRRVVGGPHSVEVYERIVQATLNRWEELDGVVRDDHELNPIVNVAFAPFGGRYRVLAEDLRPAFERLWRESPQPYSGTHHFIALNTGEYLPVTRTEIDHLFQLDDSWALIAMRMAFKKGLINDACKMVEILIEREVSVSVHTLFHLVETGFPAEKAARWVEVLGLKGVTADHIRQMASEQTT